MQPADRSISSGHPSISYDAKEGTAPNKPSELFLRVKGRNLLLSSQDSVNFSNEEALAQKADLQFYKFNFYPHRLFLSKTVVEILRDNSTYFSLLFNEETGFKKFEKKNAVDLSDVDIKAFLLVLLYIIKKESVNPDPSLKHLGYFVLMLTLCSRFLMQPVMKRFYQDLQKLILTVNPHYLDSYETLRTFLYEFKEYLLDTSSIADELDKFYLDFSENVTHFPLLLELLKEDGSSIRALSLEGMRNITGAQIAEIVDRCPNLHTLKISSSCITEETIERLGSLPHLHTLSLSYPNVASFPDHLCRLVNLKYLRIHQCLGMVGSFKWPSQIEKLEFTASQLSPECLHSMAQLKNLRELNLSASRIEQGSLGRLSELPGLESLTLPQMMGESEESEIEVVAKQVSLKFLDLTDAPDLIKNDLSNLSRLTNLVELRIPHFEVGSSDALNGLAVFRKLNALVLDNLIDLHEVDFSPLASLPGLKHLSFVNCKYFNQDQIKVLGELSQLETLSLASSDLLCLKTQFLGGLRSLVELNLSEAALKPQELTEFLQHLRKLRTVNLSLIPLNGVDLSFFRDLSQLETLDLSESGITEDEIAQIVSATSLKSLRLYKCKKLTSASLEDLALLDHLEELDLGDPLNHPELNVEPIGKMRALQKLILNSCNLSQADLTPLQALKNLVVLKVSSSKISSLGLSVIAGISSLKELSVAGCSELRDEDFGSFTEESGIEKLDISYIRNLTDGVLDKISRMKRLTSVNLSGNQNITERGLKTLPAEIKLLRF